METKGDAPVLRKLDDLIHPLKKRAAKKRMAVAAAADPHIIEAAVCAEHLGVATPLFIGDAAEIKRLLRQRDLDPDLYQIVDAAPECTGTAAVDAVRQGRAEFLMKGMLDTKDLLKPVVDKENGLNAGTLMSHAALYEIPGYPKLLCSTDGGMVLRPTAEEKAGIIRNAVALLKSIGYAKPKVAVLAAVEKVNKKMPETLDAEALVEMNRSGALADCIVEGPISYDIAMRAEIAAVKGYKSENCGDFDVFLVPDLVTGNVMGKSWSVTAGAKMAGVVLGAKVPIVLSSRGSSVEEKYYSIALAARAILGAQHE